MASTGTPQELDRFLDALSLAHVARFGTVRIGTRERLKAVHLTQVLAYEIEEPERIRGALRAAMSSTKAEAEVFDAAYREAPVWGSAPPDPDVDDSADIGLKISRSKGGTTGHADPPKSVSRRNYQIALFAMAAILLAGVIIGILMASGGGQDSNEIEVGPGQTIPSTARTERNTDSKAAEVGDREGGGGGQQNDLQIDAVIRKIELRAEAILAAAEEDGYRPSPRRLGALLAPTDADRRSAGALAQDIALTTGKGPDEPLMLLDASGLGAVYEAMYVPVTTDVLRRPLLKAVLSKMRVYGKTGTGNEKDQLVSADASGNEAATFGHGNHISKLIFSHSGEQLVTIDRNNFLYHWDLTTRASTSSFGMSLSAHSVVFSQTDTQLLITTSDNFTLLWDIAQKKEIARFQHEGDVSSSVFTQDNSHILTASADKTARLWRVDGATEIARFQHDEAVTRAVFSPDESQVLTLSDDETVVRLWDVTNSNESIQLSNQNRVHITSFSRDGNLILTTNWLESAVHLWDANGGAEIARFDHDDIIFDVTFSNDGSRILTASADNTSRIWDTDSGLEIARFEHESGLLDAIFSSDESRVLTRSDDNSSRLWDANTGQQIGSAGSVGTFGSLRPVVEGSDTIVLAGTTAVAVWDLANGTLAMHSQLNTFDEPSSLESHIPIPTLTAASKAAGDYASNMRLDDPRQIWPTIFAATIPLILAGITLAFPAAWRRSYLRRRKIDDKTLLDKLKLAVKAADPLASERRAVARLDRRHQVASHRMDANATAKATAHANGVFTPIMDIDSGSAEYVALIERRRRTDADAARLISFFQRLQRAGLSLTLYVYTGTPQVVSPIRGGRPVSLEGLRSRHAGAFLMIAGDATRYHDLRQAGPAFWTRRLGRFGKGLGNDWAGGAFLARSSSAHSAAGEAIIEDHLGMALRSTQAGDLIDLAAIFHDGKPLVSTPRETSGLIVPSYFADEPERLLDDIPPGTIDRALLIPELKKWIGEDGLTWMRSLAYYPLIRWDLARYLCSRLLPGLSAEQREQLEIAVARLPWMEHSQMPDWVRETFVAATGPEDEKAVVTLLRDLMERAEASDGDGLQISVARSVADQSRAQRSVPDGEMTDAIFIEAMARTKARPWDLPTPKGLLKQAPKVFRMPWTRLRIGVSALMLAGTAVWAFDVGSRAAVGQWLPITALLLGATISLVGPRAMLGWATRNGDGNA